MIQEFKGLYKHLNTKQAKIDRAKFLKMLKRQQKYLSKLDKYFTDTMDGVKPEEAAKNNKLL